ncbi:MAG: hypothetical protein IPM23_16195 [Candidatus Melainabacteria bacterium]|nr:hypothetical protein [Candidatus Melainabacteria bacterium]
MTAMSNSRSLVFIALPGLVTCLFWSSAAFAYPQFQEFVEKRSHQPVNCAMCHANGNGPDGHQAGQIGSLSAEELKRLEEARAALEKGNDIKSPVLNEFGNEIVRSLGRKKVISLIKEPEKLYDELPADSDLDEDGVPDREEFLDGTDPTNKYHAAPIKLFLINLNRNKMHVILAAVAIFSINFGLVHMIRGISLLAEKKN